jgi:hypothetical protein
MALRVGRTGFDWELLDKGLRLQYSIDFSHVIDWTSNILHF